MSAPGIHRYTYTLGTVPGGQDIVSADFMQNPFTISAFVNIVSGTATYSIEFTTDDLGGKVDPATIYWAPHPQCPPGQTATAIYNLGGIPVTGLRINFGNLSGRVNFTIIQSPNSTR